LGMYFQHSSEGIFIQTIRFEYQYQLDMGLVHIAYVLRTHGIK